MCDGLEVAESIHTVSAPEGLKSCRLAEEERGKQLKTLSACFSWCEELTWSLEGSLGWSLESRRQHYLYWVVIPSVHCYELGLGQE